MPADLPTIQAGMEAANVEPISRAWDVNTTAAPVAGSAADTVIAVSSSGGVSVPPFPVTVRK